MCVNRWCSRWMSGVRFNAVNSSHVVFCAYWSCPRHNSTPSHTGQVTYYDRLYCVIVTYYHRVCCVMIPTLLYDSEWKRYNTCRSTVDIEWQLQDVGVGCNTMAWWYVMYVSTNLAEVLSSAQCTVNDNELIIRCLLLSLKASYCSRLYDNFCWKCHTFDTLVNSLVSHTFYIAFVVIFCNLVYCCNWHHCLVWLCINYVHDAAFM